MFDFDGDYDCCYEENNGDDLLTLSNNEAWEDAQADMRDYDEEEGDICEECGCHFEVCECEFEEEGDDYSDREHAEGVTCFDLNA